MPGTSVVVSHSGNMSTQNESFELDNVILTSASCIDETTDDGKNLIFGRIQVSVGGRDAAPVYSYLTSGYLGFWSWLSWHGRLVIDSPGLVTLFYRADAAVTLKFLITTELL